MYCKSIILKRCVLIENFPLRRHRPAGKLFRGQCPWKHLSQEKVMISAGQASAWPKFAHILGHDEWIDIPEFQRVEDRVKKPRAAGPQ